MDQSAFVSNVGTMLEAMYSHVCEQQEHLIILSKSLMALTVAMRESSPECYERYQAALQSLTSDTGIQQLESRLQTMRSVLQRLRDESPSPT
jgi:hypothetical protein